MHGHEPVFTVPSWVEVALLAFVVYIIVAFVTGCPYCMMPNLRWPLDLCKAAYSGVLSRVRNDTRAQLVSTPRYLPVVVIAAVVIAIVMEKLLGLGSAHGVSDAPEEFNQLCMGLWGCGTPSPADAAVVGFLLLSGVGLVLYQTLGVSD